MAFREMFIRDNHRCVYCSRDLLHDFDAFWTVQQDHLDPKGGADLENMMTACFVCNNLKGDFEPGGSCREEKIVSARQHIMKRRAEKIEDPFFKGIIYKTSETL